MARKKKLTRKHIALLTATATLSNLFPYAVLAAETNSSIAESSKGATTNPTPSNENTILTYEELNIEQQTTLGTLKNTYDSTNITANPTQKGTLATKYKETTDRLYVLFTDEFLLLETDTEQLTLNKVSQNQVISDFNSVIKKINDENVKIPEVKPPVKEEPIKTPVEKPKDPIKEPVKEAVKEPVKVEKPNEAVKESAPPKVEAKVENTLPTMTKDNHNQIDSETFIIEENKNIVVKDKSNVDLSDTYTQAASIEQSILETGKLHTTPSRKMFIKQLAKSAVPVAQENGIYPSVMIAQAILESSYGGSGLSRGPNYNLFGMKGSYNGQFVAMKTLEDTGSGMYYQITAKFRKYPSYKESLEDYAKLIQKGIDGNPTIYHGTLVKNTDSFVDSLNVLEGTYATDTRYASKLMNIILSYNLTQFDAPNAMENILKDTVELTDVHEKRTFGSTLDSLTVGGKSTAFMPFSFDGKALNLSYLTNLLDFSPIFFKESKVEEPKDLIVEGQKYLAVAQTDTKQNKKGYLAVNDKVNVTKPDTDVLLTLKQ